MNAPSRIALQRMRPYREGGDFRYGLILRHNTPATIYLLIMYAIMSQDVSVAIANERPIVGMQESANPPGSGTDYPLMLCRKIVGNLATCIAVS